MMARLAGVKMGNWKGIATLILLIFLCINTRMTPSCQINYIWALTATSYFLLLLFKRGATRAWTYPLLLIFGFLAGNMNESVSFGVSGALIIMWVVNIRRFTLRQYALAIGYGLGALLILASPASRDRATVLLPSILGSTYKLIVIGHAFCILLIVMLWQRFRQKRRFAEMLSTQSFMWYALAVCILFNYVIGIGCNRQLFGEEYFAILLTLSLLRKHSFSSFWLFAFAAYFFYFLYLQFAFIMKVNDQMNEIEEQYAVSQTGEVYVHPTLGAPFSFETRYTLRIPYASIEADREYDLKTLRQCLTLKYPGRKPLILLPTQLQDPSMTDGNNHLVEVDPGLNYLFIQSKSNPEHVYVKRTIDLPFVHRDYEPMQVYENYVIKETPTYRAIYIPVTDYSIRGLSTNTFYLGK